MKNYPENFGTIGKAVYEILAYVNAFSQASC